MFLFSLRGIDIIINICFHCQTAKETAKNNLASVQLCAGSDLQKANEYLICRYRKKWAFAAAHVSATTASTVQFNAFQSKQRIELYRCR